MAKRPSKKSAARKKPTPRKPAAPRPPKRGVPRGTPPHPAARSAAHAIEFIARGLWISRGRVLLCRNLDKGYLYLPGGHIEFRESAAQALEREFLEETGVRVQARTLLLVTEGAFQTRKRWHHEINLVFHVEQGGAAVAARPEPRQIRSQEQGIAFEWIDLAAAVDLDIRPLAIKAWLAAGAGDAASGIEFVSEIPPNAS